MGRAASEVTRAMRKAGLQVVLQLFEAIEGGAETNSEADWLMRKMRFLTGQAIVLQKRLNDCRNHAMAHRHSQRHKPQYLKR